MVDPGRRRRRRLRLGVIGDAEARGLDHRKIIGAVADRDRLRRHELQALAQLGQRGELCLAPAYVGELSLVGSFWRVTGERRMTAELMVMPAFPAGNANRRELSRAAEDAIRTALALPARVPEPGTRAGRPA